MPLSDDQQAQITQAFIQIARQCELPNVDAQSLSMAFLTELESLEDGKAVELQNLFDYLVTDQRISQLDVLDFCIVLQARQDKIGVSFNMPMQAKDITPDRIERVLGQFNKKLAAATPERKPADAPQGASPAGQPEWQPKAESRGGLRRGLALTLAVSSVVALGNFAYLQNKPDTALKPIPPQQMTTGLPCSQLLANQNIAICDIPVSEWSPAKGPVLRGHAQRLMDSLASRGVTNVYVRLAAAGSPDNGKVVIRIP